MMWAACRKMKMPKASFMWILCDKSINCGGQEMIQDLEGLKFW